MLAVEVEGARYGSDKSGLLCAFAFETHQSGCPIDEHELERVVERQRAGLGGTFAWAHFNLANQASVRWMRDHLTLPAEFYDSLADTKSTRVEPTDYGLIAVMNDVTWFGAE